MQELIKKLQDDHGVTAQQGTDILGTIKSFVKDKFPMLSGAVDNMFTDGTTPEASTPTATVTPTPAVDALKADTGVMDKISDVIPGATGEKVEEFAKNAAHKAEEVFGSVKDKLSGLFGGDKS